MDGEGTSGRGLLADALSLSLSLLTTSLFLVLSTLRISAFLSSPLLSSFPLGTDVRRRPPPAHSNFSRTHKRLPNSDAHARVVLEGEFSNAGSRGRLPFGRSVSAHAVLPPVRLGIHSAARASFECSLARLVSLHSRSLSLHVSRVTYLQPARRPLVIYHLAAISPLVVIAGERSEATNKTKFPLG